MKISVIIPTIGADRAIETLRGVQSQEGVIIDEIIIVGRNLEALVGMHSKNVKIINIGMWVNAATARNMGSKSSEGDILLFIDDDCIPSKNWASANMEALRQDGVGVATGRLPGKSSHYFAKCTDLAAFWLQQNNVKKYCETFYSATMGIKRNVFNEINGFDESIDVAEDVDFAKRLIQKGYKCLYSPDIVVYHDHKKDNLYKCILFMYGRGKGYAHSLKCYTSKMNFLFKIWRIFVSAINLTVKSYRMNKYSVEHIFKYTPGMLVQYLAWYAGAYSVPKKNNTPETLILFLTSACNLGCRHCFYWEHLNKNDDLSFEEIRKLSSTLGKINSLLLSGGEPFLRKDIIEICQSFVQNNKIHFLSVPTNGTFPDIIMEKTEGLLKKLDIDITIGLSIDGLKDYHDKLRGLAGTFDKVVRTYHNLALLKKKYPKLKITVNPTVTKFNVEEVVRLAVFTKQHMPEVDYFWFCIVRGNPKCNDQIAPDIKSLRMLNETVNEIFYKGRENISRQIKMWDNLFELKIKTLEKKAQIVPCQAGRAIGVIDADGHVRACELRQPIGNIKKQSFVQIWNSEVADLMRKSINNKECYCSHECFVYPSLIKAPLLSKINYKIFHNR